MKKYISLLLSLILVLAVCFCAVPAASAAVEKIRVSVTAPAIDEQVSFSAGVGSAYYNIKTDVTDSHFINGVKWQNVSDDKYLDNGDSFVMFKIYKVTVAVVCETGYEFAASPTAELNNTAASVEIVQVGSGHHPTRVAYVSYTFPSLHRPAISTEAKSVAISGVNVPAVGGIPDYTVATDDNCKVILSYNSNGYMNGILWHDLTDQKNITVQDKFAGAHLYRVSVMIAPDNNQYFTDSLTATLNGEQATVETLDAGSAIVSYTFPATDPTVSAVHVINVSEPMAGRQPVFDAMVYESGQCEVCTALDGDRWTNGVQWYDEENQRRMTAEDAFVAGQKYTVEVLVSAIDPATFDKIYIGYINGVYGSCDVQTTGAYANRLMAVRRTYTAGYRVGDADGDGEVTIIDATAIQRRLVNLPAKSFQPKAADADCDGEVMILDATEIQRYLAELPTSKGKVNELIAAE